MTVWSKTNAWQEAIEALNLDTRVQEKGFCEITARELKLFGEPRLLAKNDSREDLPKPLSDRNWNIIAVTNDTYVIGNIEVFFSLPKVDGEPLQVSWTSQFDSLSVSPEITESEASMLCLYSGALRNFIGYEFSLTTFGRMRSDEYQLGIRVKNQMDYLTINGVQFELDAGFESSDHLVLLEMKTVPITSINLRQLYFPYRHWLVRTKKVVVPILGIWLKGELSLYRFDFSVADDISSAELVASKKYRILPERFNIASMETLAAKSISNPVSRVAPFPQADNPERLIGTLRLIEANKSPGQMVEHLKIDDRQVNYYVSALAFLGLAVRNEQGSWELATDIPDSEFELEKELVKLMIQVPPVAQVFLEGNRYSRANFNISQAKKALRESAFGSELSDSTIERRAQTIASWCRWIDSKLES